MNVIITAAMALYWMKLFGEIMRADRFAVFALKTERLLGGKLSF